MTSDHGYPDPRTSLNEEFFRDKGHDMVLTDDNINTPLYIKYPGCPKGEKINDCVGHIDLIPTIFDILKIDYNMHISKYQGQSLIPLIQNSESSERIVRSDTRLTLDRNKVTCLRTLNHKYMYIHDLDKSILYDLEKDPEETVNILEESSAVSNKLGAKFKDYFSQMEKEVYLFHKDELIKNASRSFSKLNRKYIGKDINILLITTAPSYLAFLLFKILSKVFKVSNFDILTTDKKKYPYFFDGRYNVKSFSKDNISNTIVKEYELVIFLTENSRRSFLKKTIFEGINSIKSKDSILVNYNFDVFDYFVSKWIDPIKLHFDWNRKSELYKQEPSYFFRTLFLYIESASKFIFKDKNMDSMEASDVLAHRERWLKEKKSGYNEMSDDYMQGQFDKSKTRED